MEEVCLTPRELLHALLRRFHWILLAACLGGFLGFGLCRLCLPPQYTATGSLYVSIPGSESADPGTASAALTAAQKLVNTCLVLLESDRVLEPAAQQLNCSAAELRQMLSAACLGKTEVLSLSVTHEDPETAMRIANTILDTAPGEILRIVHTGRIEVVDRASLPGRTLPPLRKPPPPALLPAACWLAWPLPALNSEKNVTKSGGPGGHPAIPANQPASDMGPVAKNACSQWVPFFFCEFQRNQLKNAFRCSIILRIEAIRFAKVPLHHEGKKVLT